VGWLLSHCSRGSYLTHLLTPLSLSLTLRPKPPNRTTDIKVFDLVQWVFLLLSIGHGYGHHPDYVSFPDFLPLAKYLFFSQPFSIWALSCAKISVACCLLRVQRGTTRPSSWRMFLFSLVGVQVIITAIINYFQFTRCRPIRAIWGEYAPDSQCVDDGTAQISIYVNLAMVAFTDLAFALLPLSMLRDRPPVHEKVAICSMVFVGFLATSATLAKMIFVHKFIVGAFPRTTLHLPVCSHRTCAENLTVDGAGLTICTNLEIQFA